MKRSITLAVAAAVAVPLVGLTALTPASAKSQAFSPAQCTAGATGSISFAAIGSGRYNVGFVTTDTGQWHVRIAADDGSVRTVDYLSATVTPGLNLTAVMSNLGKGKHSFTIDAVNLTNGSGCSGFIPAKA